MVCGRGETASRLDRLLTRGPAELADTCLPVPHAAFVVIGPSSPQSTHLLMHAHHISFYLSIKPTVDVGNAATSPSRQASPEGAP
jgi:hypothetical protein